MRSPNLASILGYLCSLRRCRLLLVGTHGTFAGFWNAPSFWSKLKSQVPQSHGSPTWFYILIIIIYRFEGPELRTLLVIILCTNGNKLNHNDVCARDIGEWNFVYVIRGVVAPSPCVLDVAIHHTHFLGLSTFLISWSRVQTESFSEAQILRKCNNMRVGGSSAIQWAKPEIRKMRHVI